MVLAMPLGMTFDMNPLHNDAFNELASLSLHFISWLLVVGYLTMVVKDISEFLRWLTDGKAGTIPNLQITVLGTGGNVAGVTMYVVIIAVTLFIWAVAIGVIMAICFSNASVDLFASFHSGPLVSAPAGSVILASAFFPFSLLFSLITGYLIFRATANFAVMLANALQRVLPG